jgi:HPt (histidine-containing phosphotransfer) domain-containing protein
LEFFRFSKAVKRNCLVAEAELPIIFKVWPGRYLLTRYAGVNLIVGTEKQAVYQSNGEIIGAAFHSAGEWFNHLKSERFDPESLWNRLDCDPDLLRELVEMFARETPRMLEQIEDAIRLGSASDLEKTSHKLKGSVLQFSAKAAAAAALELEEQGRLGSVAGAGLALNRLRHEIDLLGVALQAMLSAIRAAEARPRERDEA